MQFIYQSLFKHATGILGKILFLFPDDFTVSLRHTKKSICWEQEKSSIRLANPHKKLPVHRNSARMAPVNSLIHDVLCKFLNRQKSVCKKRMVVAEEASLWTPTCPAAFSMTTATQFWQFASVPMKYCIISTGHEREVITVNADYKFVLGTYCFPSLDDSERQTILNFTHVLTPRYCNWIEYFLFPQDKRY